MRTLDFYFKELMNDLGDSLRTISDSTGRGEFYSSRDYNCSEDQFESVAETFEEIIESRPKNAFIKFTGRENKGTCSLKINDLRVDNYEKTVSKAPEKDNHRDVGHKIESPIPIKDFNELISQVRSRGKIDRYGYGIRVYEDPLKETWGRVTFCLKAKGMTESEISGVGEYNLQAPKGNLDLEYTRKTGIAFYLEDVEDNLNSIRDVMNN